VRLPLAALASLAPGDRIALPISALGAVQLVAPGGKAVADGRLGQTGGARAIRIGDLSREPGSQAADGTAIPAGALHGSVLSRGIDFEVEPGPFQPARGLGGFDGAGSSGFDPSELEGASLDTGHGASPDSEASNFDDLRDGSFDLPEPEDLPDFPDLPALPDLPD
jgi:flagellar motor switch protein FliM